jgi:hypothetical protein
MACGDAESMHDVRFNDDRPNLMWHGDTHSLQSHAPLKVIQMCLRTDLMEANNTVLVYIIWTWTVRAARKITLFMVTKACERDAEQLMT